MLIPHLTRLHSILTSNHEQTLSLGNHLSECYSVNCRFLKRISDIFFKKIPFLSSFSFSIFGLFKQQQQQYILKTNKCQTLFI